MNYIAIGKAKREYDQEIPHSLTAYKMKHHEEESQTFSLTRHLKGNISKVTSSLFFVKIVAKVERIHSNAYQNKDNHRTPQIMGGK